MDNLIRDNAHIQKNKFQGVYKASVSVALTFCLCAPYVLTSTPAFAEDLSMSSEDANPTVFDSKASSESSIERIEELKIQRQSLQERLENLKTELAQTNEGYDASDEKYASALEISGVAQNYINQAGAKLKDLHISLSEVTAYIYKLQTGHSSTEPVIDLDGFTQIASFLDGSSFSLKSSKGATLLTQVRELVLDKPVGESAESNQTDPNGSIDIEALSEDAVLAVEQVAQTLDQLKATLQDINTPVTVEEESIFVNPCPDATTSSDWGWRSEDNYFHKGVDLAAPLGSLIYAAEAGTVIAATYDGDYNGGAGNWVVIRHEDGKVTKYMHCSEVLVSVGDVVERGQNIAKVGSTGDSTGPHLHFQVEVDGTAVCPTDFFNTDREGE
jgi:murein DD-endopeptidase MepM/ murein hydrolase activator NlpD